MKDAEADRIVDAVVRQLKAIREEKGVSVNRLAEIAGLTHVGILNIESGKRSPQLRTALKIADALGISLSDLLENTGN